MDRTIDDYRSVEGRQKAAIFMLAIGHEHSTQMFEKMDEIQLSVQQAEQSLTTAKGELEKTRARIAAGKAGLSVATAC